MSAFLLMSPVNVKGILSSSTQMYSGSLGTSPKRGFLISSQRVSADLIATDGSPGEGTPSAWRTVEQPDSASASASHNVRRGFRLGPITAHKIAHTSRQSSTGGSHENRYCPEPSGAGRRPRRRNGPPPSGVGVSQAATREGSPLGKGGSSQ